MTNFQDKIDKQFEFNQGKNIFYNGIVDSLRFSPDILNAIEKIDLIDPDTENLLIDYLTKKAIQEFCKTNQYYNFNKNSSSNLRSFYIDLFANLKSHKTSIDSIARNHYESLIKWARESNSFAEKIYNSKGKIIESVACSEYSPELQIEVLQIDFNKLSEPVLDIGCGKQGSMVFFLRQNGIDAYGFDRFAFNNSFLSNSDWFDYKFIKEKWGTIISHLGFSNHFRHHHLRNDGNFIDYAKKYIEILNSLNIGGKFYYTPDLPFVEQHLNNDKFHLTKNSIGNYEFKSSTIKRLT